jgi:hypothetical protein
LSLKILLIIPVIFRNFDILLSIFVFIFI